MTELDRLIELSVDLDDENLLSISEDGEDHIFSDSYNDKMRLLLSRHKTKPRKHAKPWRYAVASILIFVALGSAATTGAFWSEIKAFFQTIYAQYVTLGIRSEQKLVPEITDETVNSWPGYWYPNYMVDQYRFDLANEMGDLKLIIFVSDSGGQIQFMQMPASLALSADNEGTIIDGIKVNNFETYAFSKKIGDLEFNTLIWSDTATSFQLVGQISMDELIKIAQDIVYVENTLAN